MGTYRDEHPKMMNEEYGDEVLNAGWLPTPLLETEHGQEHEYHAAQHELLETANLDEFLSRVYSAQE